MWLLLGNAVLLVGNVLHVTSRDNGHKTDHAFSNRRWDGKIDGSYSELFGHLLLVGAIAGLVAIWLSRHAAVYAVWALVLATAVADDFLRLHERLGAALVRTFDLPAVAGARPQDLGELGVWAVPALVLGPALLVAHLRARGTAKRHSWILSALMLALVAFAVVLDITAYAVAAWLPTTAGRALTLIETTGEVGVMTLLAIAVHRMISSSKTSAAISA